MAIYTTVSNDSTWSNSVWSSANCNLSPDDINNLTRLRIISGNTQHLVENYQNFVNDYLTKTLSKIPELSSDDIDEIIYAITEPLKIVFSSIEGSLSNQDANNDGMMKVIRELLERNSVNFFNPYVRQEQFESTINNSLNSLKEEISKEFDEKLKVILNHEVQSNKSSTDLIGLIFEE